MNNSHDTGMQAFRHTENLNEMMRYIQENGAPEYRNKPGPVNNGFDVLHSVLNDIGHRHLTASKTKDHKPATIPAGAAKDLGSYFTAVE